MIEWSNEFSDQILFHFRDNSHHWCGHRIKAIRKLLNIFLKMVPMLMLLMNMAFRVWVGQQVEIIAKSFRCYWEPVLQRVFAIKIIQRRWFGRVDVVSEWEKWTEEILHLKSLFFLFSGNAEIVDMLIKFNANVNSIGMKNMTALLIAAKNGHAETCLQLLENRNIDIKVQDKVLMKKKKKKLENLFSFSSILSGWTNSTESCVCTRFNRCSRWTSQTSRLCEHCRSGLMFRMKRREFYRRIFQSI